METKTIKKEVEFKAVLDHVTDVGHKYHLYSGGYRFDWFILNHNNKQVKSTLIESLRILLNVCSDNYDDYLRVFGITPPISQSEAQEKCLEMIKEHNQGWQPDWSDNEQNKCYICYNHELNCVFTHWHCSIQSLPNEWYMVDNALNDNEEFLKLWKIAHGIKDEV